MDKQLTSKVVKQTMDLLITANGQVTTLEIKLQLQSLNYYATQQLVHDLVEEIFKNHSQEYKRQPNTANDVAYNVYTGLTDWETTVNQNQEIKQDIKLDQIIDQVNVTTPLHEFHISQSNIPNSKIVVYKDISTDNIDFIDNTEKPNVLIDNTVAKIANTTNIREPLFIFYTLKAYQESIQDPNSWIVTDSQNLNDCEIHVYDQKITRDQARSRYASLHGFKIDRARCRKHSNFKI